MENTDKLCLPCPFSLTPYCPYSSAAQSGAAAASAVDSHSQEQNSHRTSEVAHTIIAHVADSATQGAAAASAVDSHTQEQNSHRTSEVAHTIMAHVADSATQGAAAAAAADLPPQDQNSHRTMEIAQTILSPAADSTSQNAAAVAASPLHRTSGAQSSHAASYIDPLRIPAVAAVAALTPPQGASAAAAVAAEPPRGSEAANILRLMMQPNHLNMLTRMILQVEKKTRMTLKNLNQKLGIEEKEKTLAEEVEEITKNIRKLGKLNELERAIIQFGIAMQQTYNYLTHFKNILISDRNEFQRKFDNPETISLILELIKNLDLCCKQLALLTDEISAPDKTSAAEKK